ncbi:hypothetical protein N431DRAFT_466232 [Stipitochalara longipes BDJ]|nr:hypothetical protein N431DRAFT_466232 [Stipitochalara longipes BDJ]
MKVTVVSLLVATLVTLPFTLASPTNLGMRQSASLTACLQTADCKAATFAWNDCQSATILGATTLGLPLAPYAAQRNCLCEDGKGSTSSHPNWYSNLTSCIKCIGSAGFNDDILAPLQAWEINFCVTGELGYNDFVVEAHNYAAEYGFPLQMPDAIYVSTQTTISETPSVPTLAPRSESVSPPDDCETSAPGKTPPYTSTHSSSHTSTRAAEITAPTATVAGGCSYDNCLRQAIQSEVAVIPFCKSYTTAAQTSTVDYPAYVSMCNNQPSSISSACTCLLSAQNPTQSSTPTQSQISSVHSQTLTQFPTTIQSQASSQSHTPSQTHTSTNGGIATTTTPSHHSIHYSTVIIYTTYTTVTEGGQSSTTTETTDTTCTTTSEVPSLVSSAHSSTTTKSSSIPVEKSSRSTSFYSTTTRTTLVTFTQSSSSSTHSSTPSQIPVSSAHSSMSTVVKSSTVAASVTSSTSSSAAPASTTWITLPPSNSTKACAASQDCTQGASLYSQCVKTQVNGNQTASWNCFCQTNIDAWKSSVLNCAACIQNNLPSNPTGFVPSIDLIPVLSAALDVFCNVTDPNVKALSVSRLDATGYDVTAIFESPIDFFNMTLLNAPPNPISFTVTPPSITSTSSSIIPSGARTILSSVTVVPIPASTTSSTSTRAMTSIQVKSSTAQATPSGWITLPASQAMKQCQANACQPAARVFNGCAFMQLSSANEDPIFDCFCTTQKALWKSTLSDCTNCIAAALPAHNPATGQYQATALNSQTELVREVYCNQTEAEMSSLAITRLGEFGNLITTQFQLPINFFGMTLLTAPLT